MKFNFFYITSILVIFLFPLTGFGIDIGFKLIPIYVYVIILMPIIFLLKNIKIRFITPFEYSFIIFYLLSIIFVIYSEYYYYSLRYLLGISLVVTTYFLSRTWVSNARVSFDKIFYTSAVIFLSFTVIYYVLGLFFMDRSQEHVKYFGVLIEKGVPRLIGLGSDPNITAFLLIFFVFYFLFLKGTINRLICLVSFFCLLLTLSRGGMISLIIGFLGVLLLSSAKNILKITSSILLLLFILVILGYYNFDSIEPFLKARFSGLTTGAGRFEIWSKALYLFLDDPYLGHGTFSFRNAMYEEFSMARFAHNTYIEILIEMGIVGLFVFLFCCLSFLTLSFKMARKCDSCRFLFPVSLSSFIGILGLSLYINVAFFYLILVHSLYYLDLFDCRGIHRI